MRYSRICSWFTFWMRQIFWRRSWCVGLSLWIMSIYGERSNGYAIVTNWSVSFFFFHFCHCYHSRISSPGIFYEIYKKLKSCIWLSPEYPLHVGCGTFLVAILAVLTMVANGGVPILCVNRTCIKWLLRWVKVSISRSPYVVVWCSRCCGFRGASFSFCTLGCYLHWCSQVYH